MTKFKLTRPQALSFKGSLSPSLSFCFRNEVVFHSDVDVCKFRAAQYCSTCTTSSQFSLKTLFSKDLLYFWGIGNGIDPQLMPPISFCWFDNGIELILLHNHIVLRSLVWERSYQGVCRRPF